MKIWNGYLKNWIDLKKHPINKSTWNHGFITGCLLTLVIFVIIYDIKCWC